MFALLAIAALASVQSTADEPNRAFTLQMAVSPEMEEGRRLIALKAMEICGDKYPRLGRYRFSGTERLTGKDDEPARYEVRQELVCLDVPPAQVEVEAAPADWQPTEADNRQVVALTQRYFAMLDAGDAAAAHALWSSDNQAMTPLAERAASLKQFRKVAGSPLRHRIAKLTWYVNPPSAPTPGIYVAVDYERAYSGLSFNCGYVAWRRDGSGGYALVREETGLMTRKNAAEMTPEKLAEMRGLMRCPPG